jgi:hypothetical protein
VLEGFGHMLPVEAPDVLAATIAQLAVPDRCMSTSAQ